MKHVTHHTKQEGFTLIEMIVATGVFIVVMVIAVGALLSLVGANRKARSQKAALNNIHFAVDQIVREVRVGTTYHCGSASPVDTPVDCVNGANMFFFEKTGGNPSVSSDQIGYRLTGGRIEKTTNGGGSFTALTAPDVTISQFEVTVVGSDPADSAQPKIYLVVQGSAGTEEKTRTEFDIQTVISQRIPD